MRGLLAPRPRNDSPVPFVGRRMGGGLSNLFQNRTDAVNQLSAMGSVGTLFSIVNRTSNKTAQVTWHLYRKAKSGKPEDRVEITSHAALDLWNKPNAFMPQQEFVETQQQHIDLTGEAWWVITRNPRVKLPLEMWPVRPDRMAPVPHPTKFLTGYVYTSPDGERIPLGLDEVIQLRMPNPLDPYRGMGPVQALLTDLDTNRYTAEWNRNFFRNSAEPGGIIEVEKRLSDPEFDEMNLRWNEQHRGVANAHRVAIIEQGKWVPRTFSMKDMQFTELRNLSRDVIMEAFGISKTALGISDDVNRAVALAAKALFAEDLTVPRLERIKGALNHELLPLYGDTARNLEFDYDSPVPADQDAENAERESKASAAYQLIEAGFTGDSVKEGLDLPEALVWEKPAPPPAPTPPPVPGEPADPNQPDQADQPGEDQTPPVPAPTDAWAAQIAALLPRNAALPGPPPDGWPEHDPDTVDAVDLGPVQAAWETALAALLDTWRSSVVAQWVNQLVDAVRAALRGEGDLTRLTVDTAEAARILGQAMGSMAETAAGHAVKEAATQDVELQPAWPSQTDLDAVAKTIAAFEGQRYAQSAGREAARVSWPGVDVDEVANHIRVHLDQLSDATSEAALGEALTDAQNQARRTTFRHGPVGALYASEQMDKNTCEPCRAIHGRWVCNTDDLGPLLKLYPAGGYIDCLGTWRCRGTVVGVWRPQTTKGGQ